MEPLIQHKSLSNVAPPNTHHIFLTWVILGEIFSHLRIQDLFHCCRVNKLWSKLSLDLLWRGSINRGPWLTPPLEILNNIYHESPLRLESYLQRVHYMRIDFSACDGAAPCTHHSGGYWQLLKHTPQHTNEPSSCWKARALVIRNLQGSIAHNNALNTLLHENLLCLVLKAFDSKTIDLQAVFRSIQLNCPRLQGLIMPLFRRGLDRTSSANWLEFFESMPSMTHVCFGFPFLVSTSLASHIFERPNLQYLELIMTRQNAQNSEEAIEKALKIDQSLRFPQLKVLDLFLKTSCTRLVKKILECCTQLQRISISTDETHSPLDVVETVFIPLSERARLRHVRICAPFAKHLDASVLIDWVKSAPLLNYLHLTHKQTSPVPREPVIRFLTFQKQEAEKFAAALPSIECLNLDLQGNLTADELLVFSGRNCPHLEALSLRQDFELYDLVKLLPRPIEGPGYVDPGPVFPSLLELCLQHYTCENTWTPEQSESVDDDRTLCCGGEHGDDYTCGKADVRGFIIGIGAVLNRFMPHLEIICSHRQNAYTNGSILTDTLTYALRHLLRIRDTKWKCRFCGRCGTHDWENPCEQTNTHWGRYLYKIAEGRLSGGNCASLDALMLVSQSSPFMRKDRTHFQPGLRLICGHGQQQGLHFRSLFGQAAQLCWPLPPHD